MDDCEPRAYASAIGDVLRGAARNSSQLVAEGLTRMLIADPEFVSRDAIASLICPQAHGLYRLCQRYSEDLVSKFDTTRVKPWDAEFHAWWEQEYEP